MSTEMVLISKEELENTIKSVIDERVKHNLAVFAVQKEKEKEKGKKDRYLTSKEVRAMLKVSRSTLHRYRRNGVLPSYKMGGCVRFLHSEVEKVVENFNKYSRFQSN